MQITILANETLKQEILQKGFGADVHVNWISDPQHFNDHTNSDLFIDMDFEGADTETRVSVLRSLGKPAIINAVSTTLASIGNPPGFIRINGWPGFVAREIVEISAAGSDNANGILQSIGWKFVATPDIPGFYTARVIAAIINEAYHTLGDGVSSKEEIDIAMKLGTNYPHGPFEWAGMIGIKNIHRLLDTLSKEDPRYTIAPSLVKEMNP